MSCKNMYVDYKKSHENALNTIKQAESAGEISRTQAAKYAKDAQKNYANREYGRQMERVYGDKVKVREV